MSLAEFLALPEEKPELELIDGEVCQKPMGKARHSRAQWKLQRALDHHPQTQRGQIRPELTLPIEGTGRANARVPDVSYYLPGRAPIAEPYADELPDLVAEVRSQGQTRESIDKRLAFLRDRGVHCTLLIDPESNTVTVHDGDRTWTASEEDHVTLARLDGFDFAVADLFSD